MTSTSAAHNTQSQSRIFVWWHVLLFTALLLIMLLLLFPQKLLLKALLTTTKADPLAISYLYSFSAQDPHNVELKITLAKQQMLAGKLNEAAKLIAPYLTPMPHTALQWQTFWIYYQIMRTYVYELPAMSRLRSQQEKQLKILLRSLLQSPYLDIDQRADLAQDALALDEPKLALQLYQQAVQAKVNKPPAYFAGAGQAALFVSDYEASANFYFIAMKRSTTLAEKRKYYMGALDSLRAAGKPQGVMQIAQQHIDGLAQDRDTQLYLVKLALAVNNPQAAQDYMQQVLHLRYLEAKP